LLGLAAFTSKVAHFSAVEAWNIADGKLLWWPDGILLWRCRRPVELLLLLLVLQAVAPILLLLRSAQLTPRWGIQLTEDAGIILFLFFSSASATAFISLS
jgi:hypothetical protein